MGLTATYTIRDGKGKDSTTEINLPTGLDPTKVATFASDLSIFIHQLIDGQITRIGIGLNVPVPVLGGSLIPPTANSDVEEGARFQFRTDGGFFSRLRLPTIKESVIVPGTAVVDVDNTDVDNFVAVMLNGATISGTLVAPSDARDDDLESLSFAKEAFTSSRAS